MKAPFLDAWDILLLVFGCASFAAAGLAIGLDSDWAASASPLGGLLLLRARRRWRPPRPRPPRTTSVLGILALATTFAGALTLLFVCLVIAGNFRAYSQSFPYGRWPDMFVIGGVALALVAAGGGLEHLLMRQSGSGSAASTE